MTAAILPMEKPRHRMTPEEFNKRLAALGPDKKQATLRWEHGLAELFYESDWTQEELGRHLHLSQQRIGQIVTFGLWLEWENTTQGSISRSVSEKLFRKCWLQTAKGKKQAQADIHTRCLQVTPLIEKELAKPPASPKPKVTPSKTEKVTLESLVKPGRWDEAKKLISAMARDRAEESTKSMKGFYEHEIAEAKASKAEYDRLSRKVNQIMTQTEYRLVLGCLHPDRQTEAERKKYERAFEIFKRLEQSVKW